MKEGIFVGKSSSIPRQLPLSPMCVFAIRVEHALDVTVRRPQDVDAREHRQAAQRRNQHQRFHCRLPFRRGGLGFGKLGDVGAGVLQGGELAPAGQRDWIFERTLPNPDR